MSRVLRCCLLVWLGFHPGLPSAAVSPNALGESLPSSPGSSSWSDVGTSQAGAGLEVLALPDGSLRISCAFQRLEGDITPEGLWLTSTSPGTSHPSFRVVARAVRRDGRSSQADPDPWAWTSALPHDDDTFTALQYESEGGRALPLSGSVIPAGDRVRFERPGLLEEYSVSVDGVRQDFVVEQPPAGTGELRLELALSGATAEMALPGGSLVLTTGGRKIAYSRLCVTDARGAKLPARLETEAPHRLTVVVDDSGAAYPVRIDPTFSDANWVSMGGVSGVDGIVNVILPNENGTLFIAGDFKTVGTTRANNIAQWNGSSWQALGTGTDSSVLALAKLGDNLFVAGAFTNAGGVVANGIARWNGTAWSALGSGAARPGLRSSSVRSLAIMGSTLYAGGDFTSIGGVAANSIARWNGTVWSPLGPGINGWVFALAPSGTNLYAGGYFRTAGTVTANGVARWNGRAWSALGAGVSAPSPDPSNEPFFPVPSVFTLVVSGSSLYAGGMFTQAGNVPAKRVARWNGSAWSALGSGMDGTAETGPFVTRLAFSGGTLYAGGQFSTASGLPAASLAKWTGSAWSTVRSGVNGAVYALAPSGTSLLVGGNFTLSDGVSVKSLAKLSGDTWAKVDSETPLSTDAAVSALAHVGTNLVVGGSFTQAGRNPANRVAQWSQGGWTNLGSGFNGPVTALAQSGENLYAGGDFNRSGTTPVAWIARWTGRQWTAVGRGFLQPVTAMAAFGDDLYVAGSVRDRFFNPEIARWNGVSWATLGSGLSGPNGAIVSALAATGEVLYAGGSFQSYGNKSVPHVAQWDGKNWLPVGLGLSGPVRTLVWREGSLFAGGTFLRVAGTGAATPLNRIAQWNGQAWAPLGFGVNGPVNALAWVGTRLVVGGDFTQATNASGQTVPTSRLAIWDGSEWSALGSGVNGSVSALTVSGSELFVGGMFSGAGDKASLYLAKVILPREPVISSIGIRGTAISIACSGDPALFYDVQRSEILNATGWLTINPTPLRPDAEGNLVFVDPAESVGTAYYRLVER
ncbi:MAG: hypothetical protein J0M24_22280 [Verrucomicrobia bacterium]|nr:hypothetical protein [Verrucomicrobiota bacterium]